MNGVLQLRRILGSLLLLLSFVDKARSELITFKFSGTVTDVYVEDWRPQLQGFDFPDVGDPFTGFYIFDSDARDTAASLEQGSFKTVLPDTAVGVSIGEVQFEGKAVSITTFQNAYGAGDWIPRIEVTSNPALAQILDHNNFSLAITKDNLLPGPILPLTPPSLVGAEQASLRMRMDNSSNLSPVPWVAINASLQSLSIVPEPPSLLLLGAALIFSLQSRDA